MEFYIFLTCLFSGIIGGVIYDVIYVVKVLMFGVEGGNAPTSDKGKKNDERKSKKKVERGAGIFFDVLFFILFSALSVFIGTLFSFPDFRAYMFIGNLLGLLLYLKSVHIIVAFFIKRVYNITRKVAGGNK